MTEQPNLCPHCNQPMSEVCTTCESPYKEETERKEAYKRFWRATPAYSPQEELER